MSDKCLLSHCYLAANQRKLDAVNCYNYWYFYLDNIMCWYIHVCSVNAIANIKSSLSKEYILRMLQTLWVSSETGFQCWNEPVSEVKFTVGSVCMCLWNLSCLPFWLGTRSFPFLLSGYFLLWWRIPFWNSKLSYIAQCKSVYLPHLLSLNTRYIYFPLRMA